MLAKGFVLALLGATTLAAPLTSREGDASIVKVKRSGFSPTLMDAATIEEKRDGGSSGGPIITDGGVVETKRELPIIADDGIVEVGSGHGTSKSPRAPAADTIEARDDDIVPAWPILADGGVVEMVKI